MKKGCRGSLSFGSLVPEVPNEPCCALAFQAGGDCRVMDEVRQADSCPVVGQLHLTSIAQKCTPVILQSMNTSRSFILADIRVLWMPLRIQRGRL